MNHLNRLRALGWTPHEACELASHASHLVPARVSRVEGPLCHLLGPDTPSSATIPGRLRGHPEHQPVVGDWVLVAPDTNTVAVVLARKTRIARAAAGARTSVQIIAANVDRVFVVMGLDGDFNPRRLERYLAVCADAGTDAVVLLTKAGACADPIARLDRCRRVAQPAGPLCHHGAAVHAIDVIDGLEQEIPQRYAEPGRTIALLGSSGAGKSTLANHLLGQDRMETAAVRDGDQRGRHTTAHRELLELPSGGLLIDNPGMRQLALWLDEDGLVRAFADVASAASACRFSDCSHSGEPGCAVRAAIDDGNLDADRLASFQRLQGEVEATERRRSTHRHRDHEREKSKHYRRVLKERRRRRGE